MMESSEFWYEVPHQVVLWDGSAAIVFHEYLIGAATGTLYRIKDILHIAQTFGISEDDAIIEFDDWVNFSGKIRIRGENK